MADFNENYKRIVSELTSKMENEQDKKLVEEKMSELSLLFLDVISSMTDHTQNKIKQLEETQRELGHKVELMEQNFEELLGNIYEEEDFDFEIVCPYCNHQFVIDMEQEDLTKEIRCPECQNMIELDWDLEGDCEGDCSCCHHDCEEMEAEEEQKEDENDDDM